MGFDSEALRPLSSCGKFSGPSVFLVAQGDGSGLLQRAPVHSQGLARNASASCEVYLNPVKMREMHGLHLILNTFSEVKHSVDVIRRRHCKNPAKHRSYYIHVLRF